jgi:hypothetical protein
MVLPFDPNEVIAYDTRSDQGRVVAVKLVLRNGKVRAFEGDALTDEVREWLQAWETARSKPPARESNPSTPNRKSS